MFRIDDEAEDDEDSKLITTMMKMKTMAMKEKIEMMKIMTTKKSKKNKLSFKIWGDLPSTLSIWPKRRSIFGY